MSWSTFVAVFIPGLLIGGSSSFLLLSLWSAPISFHDTKEREVVEEARIPEAQRHPVVGGLGRSEDLGGIQRKNERRHVLEHYSNSGCNDTHLESQPVSGGPYHLLVLVHSSTGSQGVKRRQVIRETWLRENHKQGKFVARFVIGVADLGPGEVTLLSCENTKHGDLLFLPHLSEDSRDFSASEKLLQSFIWASKNVDFRYIFKCTDSTFAILDSIVSELETKEDGDYLWGFFAGGMQATKDGHLGEKNWFLCTHYLPYPEGGGYVISKGLVSILQALSNEFQLYTRDDIALGVWLSTFNGIERKHDVRFNTGYYSRGCSNVYIVTHRESAQSMLSKYSSLHKSGKLCEEEYSAKPSYRYNWSVPSNRCCVRESGVP